MAKFTQPTEAQGAKLDAILSRVFNSKHGGVPLPDDLWMKSYSVEGDDSGEGKKALNDFMARWAAIIGDENVKLKTIKIVGQRNFLLFRADADVSTLKPLVTA
jgi:hypothetical protein